MLITGCTVAQHCYNRHVTLLRENGNYDPIKIETLEHIVIMRGTSVPNLVQICPRGPSGQAGELQLSCFLCFLRATRSIERISYGYVAGWLAGWLGGWLFVTAGSASKRLNLS